MERPSLEASKNELSLRRKAVCVLARPGKQRLSDPGKRNEDNPERYQRRTQALAKPERIGSDSQLQKLDIDGCFGPARTPFALPSVPGKRKRARLRPRSREPRS